MNLVTCVRITCGESMEVPDDEDDNFCKKRRHEIVSMHSTDRGTHAH